MIRVLLVALVVVGCRAAPPPDPRTLTDADYPGVLRPVAALGADVLCRQRVTATWGGESRSFDAVLQTRGETLTLLGLSPLGQVGFVLTLHDGEVSFENRTEMELPFPPRFILLDVQRVFYPWLEPGVLEGEVDGERVVERRRDGALLERTFTRLDGAPAGAIVVRLEGHAPGRVAPARAELENGWFGYRLSVETVE